MAQLRLLGEFALAQHFDVVSRLENRLGLFGLHCRASEHLVLDEKLFDELTLGRIRHVGLLIEVLLLRHYVVVIGVRVLVVLGILRALLVVFELPLVKQSQLVRRVVW